MCPMRHFIFDNPVRGERGFLDRAKKREGREESKESEESEGGKERGEREQREEGAKKEINTLVTRELRKHTALENYELSQAPPCE